MNILIIEDEQPNRNRIIRLLKQLGAEYNVVGETSSIIDTITFLREHSAPDLILADIRLSDGLSFDIFKEVEIDSPIIFTTAYDEYAIQAFKYNSFDYLLKPIDADELKLAINKVQNHSEVRNNQGVKELVEYMQHSQYKYRGRFLLPYRDGYKTINVSDISHISLENKNSVLFLNDGTSAEASYSMEELEVQLEPAVFFRANRQYIININSITNIGNYFNGKLKVKLLKYPNIEILISRDKTKLFKMWLDR